MSYSAKNRFSMRGRTYQADAVAAVVQRGEDVEVRYADQTPSVRIPNASVERVTYAIEQAKASADSA